MLDAVDNWIKWYYNSDIEKCATIVSLEEYAEILNNIIEWLSREQKRRNNDERRDRALGLMSELESMWVETSRTKKWFSNKSMNFLSDYRFDSIKNTEDAILYIQENWTVLNWNNIKYNAFLKHFFRIKWSNDTKTDILLTLFESDIAKPFTWEEDNYLLLASLVRKIKNSRKKQALKIAFNALPKVKIDRRKWDWKTNNDPWNTLYFERMWHGWEAKWYDRDSLWKLPQRLWPLAAKGSSK